MKQPNRHQMLDSEVRERIFDLLISCQISTYMCTYAPDIAVVSVGDVVSLLKNVSKYQARKALKSLIADGLVYYTSQGRPAVVSCGEVPELITDAATPINGYALTEKGFQSEEYKKAYEEWERSLAEWANGTDSDLSTEET